MTADGGPGGALRVGIACPYDWDVPGGVMAHVRDLAEELRARGHHVGVLAPAADDADLPDYVTSVGRSLSVRYNGSVARIAFGPATTRRVRRWLRDNEFDVLHVHEPLSPSCSVLAVWCARGPMVGTFHIAIPRSRIMAYGYALAQTVLEKLGGRIAVSEKARQTVVDHLGGDAVLIPNGVSLRHYRGTSRLPDVPDDGRTLLFLGRIDEPRKGLQVLVGALPAILAAEPGVRVLVAGPGDADAVRATLPPEAVDRVEFLGLVSEDDKARAYRTADLYVAPHVGGESFGIVLLEAMASDTAVVASDLEAFRRVLDDGAAGRLFTTGDSAALAAAVIDLLRDDAERRRLAEAGARRAARFDWAVVADEILDVYRTVVVPGAKVEEDLRGQLVGRLAWGRRRDGTES